MRTILKDSTGNKAILYITQDATDAKPWTGLAYNATGLEVWIKPIGGSPVQLTLSAGIWAEAKHGEYEIAIPDTYYQTLATYSITGTITGGDVTGELHRVVLANDQLAAFGANTVTPNTTAPDNAGIAQLVSRVPGLLRTKAEDDATDAAMFETMQDTEAAIASLQADVDDLTMRPAFDPTTDTVTVGNNQDKTGYGITQAFPANFPALAIDEAGEVTAANITAPDNAGIAAIKAKTDNLPASPAATGDVQFQFAPTINPTELSTGSTNAIREGLATSSEVATLATKLDTLLGRVTAAVASLWGNLAAMITGTGPTAAFTAEALENAPAGGTGEGGGLTAAGMRNAIGLADANLDDQLAAILEARSGASSAGIGSRGAAIVRRSTSDHTPIRFIWPTADATITAARQKADGSYEPAEGSVEYFATESGEYWYKLSYAAADRPESDGTVRYRFTAGDSVRYVFLHQFSAGGGTATVDLQPVIDAIENAEGVENEAIADAVAARLSPLVLTVQSHANNATGELTITRGDDYTQGAAIRIEIESAADLTGLHLVIAATSEHGDTFAVRMPILGTAPEHYANFCPSGELTEQWPEGDWHLRHRIEHEPGKLRTVARSRMIVRTFPTPAEIIDLA